MGRGVCMLTEVQAKLIAKRAVARIIIELVEWVDFHVRYFCVILPSVHVR